MRLEGERGSQEEACSVRVLKSTQSGVHSDRDSCRRRACSGTAQFSKAGGNGYIVVASYAAGRWTNHTYSYMGHDVPGC